MTVSTTIAVVAVCDRCGKRSKPLDPQRVDNWAKRHVEAHETADRRARLAAAGHAVRGVVEWMIEDDSKGHAKCSCGWVSESAKACWIDEMADRHLLVVDQS